MRYFITVIKAEYYLEYIGIALEVSYYYLFYTVGSAKDYSFKSIVHKMFEIELNFAHVQFTFTVGLLGCQQLIKSELI